MSSFRATSRWSGSSRAISRSACSGGELGQQRRPVVGRHLVEDGRRLLVGDRAEHRELGLEVEILERLGRQARGEHAEDADLLLGLELGGDLAQVGREPAVDDVAHRLVVARLEQFSDLG